MDNLKIPRKVQEWFFQEEPYIPQGLIENAGGLDAKYQSSVSQASHLLNSVLIGLNCYSFDKVQLGEEPDPKEVKILTSALALHDVNKYTKEQYGLGKEGNTREALERYFKGVGESEGDDFGIEEYLGDGYFDDLLYLIQRTEIQDDSTESRGTETDISHLSRYCRLGDACASIATKDGIQDAAKYLEDQYAAAPSDPVHLLEFEAVEQPILNDRLVAAVKMAVTGDYSRIQEENRKPSGVVIGSTGEAVLYLGEPVDRDEFETEVTQILKRLIPEEFGFSCKVGWNKFDYDILGEVSIPFDRKKEIIQEEFSALLERGSAGVDGFEEVPVEFKQYLPHLAKAIYLDGLSEFDNPTVQKKYDELKEWDNQKVKLHFIAYLLETFPDHQGFLDNLKEELDPEIKRELEPHSDGIALVVGRYFGGGREDEPGLSKGKMCFLCGRESTKEYKKGRSAFYQVQGFSRRTKPHEKWKNICETCNLEYSLLQDLCGWHDVHLTSDVEVAYFYFDEFVSDVRLYGGRVGSLIQGDTITLDDPEVAPDLLTPQYHLQPFYIRDKNHRMAIIRQVQRKVQDTGLKTIVGKPFTRFSTSNNVFEDEEPIRLEEVLKIDEVERYEDLSRPLDLFDIIATVGAEADLNNSYLELDQDDFHSIADFVVVNHDSDQPMRNTSKYRKATKYLKKHHWESLMEMKEVARKGMDLFGPQYDSKYKKTKIFRECLDATLSGMSQGMDEDAILEHIGGQVYETAKREKYSGQVKHEDAKEFVESVQEYLKRNDLDNLKKLSDWENALVNSYYFAYDQLLYSDEEDE